MDILRCVDMFLIT